MSEFKFNLDYAHTSFHATFEKVNAEFEACKEGNKTFWEAMRAATAILHRENQRLELLFAVDKVNAESDERVKAAKAYWLAHRLMTGDDKLDKNEALGLIWLKNAADLGDERAKYELGE